MTRLAMVVLVLLGYLVSRAEAVDGEAAGRFSLELVGLVVTAFLLYLRFSGAIMTLFSGKWRRRRPFVERRDLSEVASAGARSGDESPEAPKARP